jgi:hypothetical protein
MSQGAEDEGRRAEDEDGDDREDAADRDERTVTETGGYGTPERGTDEDAD